MEATGNVSLLLYLIWGVSPPEKMKKCLGGRTSCSYSSWSRIFFLSEGLSSTWNSFLNHPSPILPRGIALHELYHSRARTKNYDPGISFLQIRIFRNGRGITYKGSKNINWSALHNVRVSFRGITLYFREGVNRVLYPIYYHDRCIESARWVSYNSNHPRYIAPITISIDISRTWMYTT